MFTYWFKLAIITFSEVITGIIIIGLFCWITFEIKEYLLNKYGRKEIDYDKN